MSDKGNFCKVHFYTMSPAPLAQPDEQLTLNQWVPGSLPETYSKCAQIADLLHFSLFQLPLEKTVINCFFFGDPEGAPKKDQVARLGLFYPSRRRRLGMELPRIARRMESVAKRRYGITALPCIPSSA